jgi:sulfur carrier protein
MTTHVATLDLVVNGEPRQVPEGSTLPELLRTLDIDPAQARGVAVAVNEAVVRKQDWATVTLQAGDHVEVITATQGG